ncbi:hypothetical protein [Domibacillus enclensis]|uniref:Uncharacterized protein n=1 Tax=Domibacillus enclensis TaxID=1017273 RepID=A0A1N6TX98_9BACI|nr:hypothetical protein [Domibacillus enclensis]OXS78380.1 hypothetical protein B1B05_07145 [Domibacillus enclensis]SIQ58010.1 hypothetical protein SAMN05443094_103103 [Domibacillus enclensis]
MTVAEFYGGVEYSVTQFAVQLTNEIEEKIAKRDLFYEDQIIRYIERRATLFIQSLTLTPAVSAVMKKEVAAHVLYKLKPVMKHQIVFQIAK